jgi:hypothetical protein
MVEVKVKKYQYCDLKTCSGKNWKSALMDKFTNGQIPTELIIYCLV